MAGQNLPRATKPLRVRFNCITERDGMMRTDPDGRENPHILYRQVIVRPGSYMSVGQVDRDSGVLRPRDSNFLTYNKLLSFPHAMVEPGIDDYSIILTDCGSMNGIRARTLAPNPCTGVGEYDYRWTKLEPRVRTIVRSGTQVKFGECAISPDGQRILNGPIWEVIVEPVDKELEAKILAAAVKEPEPERSPNLTVVPNTPEDTRT